jgi:hypothetical protein
MKTTLINLHVQINGDLCQKSPLSLDNKNPYILWSVHFMVKGRFCLEGMVSQLLRVAHIR